MTETISNANAAASTLFFGHNGEWWDFWLILSGIAAAAVATAIGVTTAGSIISHKRETRAAEQALELYKLDTGKQIAEANAAGDAAKAEVAKAQLALEKFKAPRNLIAEESEKLKSALSAFRGIPYDLSIPVRMEPGSSLINQLIANLRQAKWELRSYQGNVMKSSLGVLAIFAIEPPLSGPLSLPQIDVATNLGISGVLITFDLSHSQQLSDAAHALARALNDIGIISESGLAAFPNGESKDVVHLTIGTKP